MHFVIKPASQPASQLASKTASQPASQPTSQPTSQPATHPASRLLREASSRDQTSTLTWRKGAQRTSVN
ncbi:hypothetical protein E2C01_003361 [Portunus trituberculatus]|uniref:Uncharacterized protein n=1 Tax=Portunus trituberculatus TaxID=210409 RepID=A0A5B7CPK4_PORTR|nr:hypothetical protein [Portunus trituberculatus]